MVITQLNELIFELDQDNHTAKVIKSPSARGSVLIPHSINYDSQEYVVKRIEPNAFKNNNLIISIEFPDDSEVTSIGSEVFAGSSVQKIIFHASLQELEEGWCLDTDNLTDIEVSPNNPYFSITNDKIMVKKSDINNDFFDILAFTPRNVKELIIPSFIKCIDSYAVNHCGKLTSVFFETNSELISINKYAFSDSSFESISIPSSVTEIQDFAFYHCQRLIDVQIPEDSQLISIGKYCFSETYIESFTIPPQLQKLDECWKTGISNFSHLSISPHNTNFKYFDNECQIVIGKSDPNQDIFDVLVYVDGSIENFTIPLSIEYISSYVFSPCTSLDTVTIPEDSKLRIISKSAFSNSSIKCLKISSNIEEFEEDWCYNTVMLNQVLIPPSNNHFSYCDESMILGKTDQNSKGFDTIIFANRSIQKATIPSFIKRIKSYSFSGCRELRSVTFTDNSELCLIEKNSFSCSSIESITIPKHVTMIGESAFTCCSRLRKVLFTTDCELQLIDKEAFSHSYINSISIPSSVKKINEGAFSCCSQLRKVEIPPDSQLEMIDKKLFTMTPIQNISIPSKIQRIEECAFFCCNQLFAVEFAEDSELTFIGLSAFSHTALTSITIPQHVQIIKEEAFFKCLNLETINFSEDSELEIIEKESFCKTSISSILIPKKVRIIGESSFSECQMLEGIEFEKESELISIGQEAFSDSSIEEIYLPNHIKQIESNVFHYCCQLHTIGIDDDSDLYVIEGYAFSDSTLENLIIPKNVQYLNEGWCCGTTELMNVKVSPNNPYFKLIDDNLIIGKEENENNFNVLIFAPRNIKNITIPSFIKRIAPFALSGCQNLQTVKFEDNPELSIIDQYAFSLSSIEHIKIPFNVKVINDSAFSDCDQLKYIDIDENCQLESIGAFAFSDSVIDSLTFPSNLMELKDTWCGEISFLTGIKISEQNEIFGYLDETKKIIIKLRDTILFACRDIEHAFIPSFVKKIDICSFNRCKKLKSIEFEENSEIETIDWLSFSESTVEKVVFPKSITKIGKRAFLCCNKLKEIRFENDSIIEAIGCEAFEHTGLVNIELPPCIRIIENAAFASCFDLISIEYLGEFVSIEENVFNNSDKLFLNSFPNASKVFVDFSSFHAVAEDFALFINPYAELINPLRYGNNNS